MALSFQHDSIDDIPEPYRDLYSEREGKFVLTGISGIKTQADIERVQEGARKEREDHGATKEELRKWRDLGIEYDELTQKLDRYQELEVAAKGSKEEMDAKLEELTEARITSRLAPVERENRTLKQNLEEAQSAVQKYETRERHRCIIDAVDKAAAEGKVRESARDDVRMLASSVFDVDDSGKPVTKENPWGVPPGLTPELFIEEMKPVKHHWWEPTEGGGAKGSEGGPSFANNPFAKDNWSIDGQAKVYKEHGPEKARQMAKAAGVDPQF